MDDNYRELLIGCGSRRIKDLSLQGSKEFLNPTTLDINLDHKPDVVHDLTVHPLPFADSTFDEIHAYDVLEHLAYQGDYKFFFAEFTEYHRILKPGGIFCASVPRRDSIWAIGDPSHKRIITSENLIYLSQKTYADQVGKTKISDFRNIYKADFKLAFETKDDHIYYFCLEKV